MKKKIAVSNQSSKPMNKPSKSVNNHRGFGVIELLFAVSTIGAAILVAASRGPKVPPGSGD